MKIEFQFKWFDLWIGLFVDIKNKALYFCPLPMFVIKITLPQIPQKHYLIYGQMKNQVTAWWKSNKKIVPYAKVHNNSILNRKGDNC